jgi:hypothetical protein
MEAKVDRKEAIRKWKERKPANGAFAIRCTVTGSVWVGSSVNLDAIHNRHWFTLRMGSHADKDLQQEWNRHGEAVFVFEVLEKLKDDTSPISIPALLKEKKAHWVQELSATALTI